MENDYSKRLILWDYPFRLWLQISATLVCVFAMSTRQADCPRNVVILRSDIPKVRPTFDGHSDVYRVRGYWPISDAFICDDANGRA